MATVVIGQNTDASLKASHRGMFWGMLVALLAVLAIGISTHIVNNESMLRLPAASDINPSSAPPIPNRGPIPITDPD